MTQIVALTGWHPIATHCALQASVQDVRSCGLSIQESDIHLNVVKVYKPEKQNAIQYLSLAQVDQR